MSGAQNFVPFASRAVVAAQLLFGGPGALGAEPEGGLAHRLCRGSPRGVGESEIHRGGHCRCRKDP